MAVFCTATPANADNPIVQTIYTADPAPLVHDGRVYLYTGHDEDGSTYFTMNDWHVFSSADMVNWNHHGSPLSLATFSWADQNAWAGHVIERNGKFYWYVPVRQRSNGQMVIGVAVADSPTGPFRDALGRPLVGNSEIDPHAFIDDNGQAYLYWGNPNLWYVRLNADMISFSGSPTQIPLTTAGFGTRTGHATRTTLYEEGPWVYKRNGLYYNVFAAECCSEFIGYSTATGPTGPWTYRGTVMPRQGSSFTNHPGIIDFAGGSYFFYHNGALPGGGGYTRSVAVEKFSYNTNGTIPTMNMTTTGAPQVGTLNPFVRQEAETIAWSSGIETEPAGEGTLNVGWIENGDYIKVKGVAFGSGATSFTTRVASGSSGGNIEVRLGGPTGTQVGSCGVPGTGGWQTWTTVSCPVTGASGTHDLYLRFTGGSGYLLNADWWQFSAGGNPPPTTAPPTTAPPTTAPPTTAPPPTPGSSCTATVSVPASWQGGYEGRLTVTNATTATTNGWRVTFTLPAGQTVSQGWSGTFSQQGNQVTVTNASYNGQLSAGSSTTAGFIASTSGGSQPPTSVTCTAS
ncbi:family 43 glycosylhydrolase [Micromonospora sp. NBC_01813]|uniref:family 43 glycosylhydrolase n=1 Tax=Micromonospora sp. NBC_01813 TaxID=2975988 RepID=UPI002DD86309|nr:family 43 glycosylhydrolase [Micromonospora sp. NBC_01813]WSA12881.1 family 43 glycosylhydrolase [Micromonospora sp. NBC_01813]